MFTPARQAGKAGTWLTLLWTMSALWQMLQPCMLSSIHQQVQRPSPDCDPALQMTEALSLARTLIFMQLEGDSRRSTATGALKPDLSQPADLLRSCSSLRIPAVHGTLPATHPACQHVSDLSNASSQTLQPARHPGSCKKLCVSAQRPSIPEPS